jgi:hypothetical protein
MLEHEGLAVRQYMWLARSKPILLLLTAWGMSYAGDLAAFTAAREEFLAAVTGSPESVENAEEVVSTRLQAG